MNKKFVKEIKDIKGVKIETNKHIDNLQTMKVKGKVSYFISIKDYIKIKKVMNIIKKYKYKYFVIGGGSNVLFSKYNNKLVLIKFNDRISKYLNILYAGNRANLVNKLYLDKGVSSLRCLFGVPCNISGAIYMNASSYNYSISDVIEYVYVFDIKENRFKCLSNNECKFSYRDSIFKSKEYIILGAKIKLIYHDKDELINIYHKIIRIRNSKIERYPNLGSIFKNGDNYKAYELIKGANLNKKFIKNVRISSKHFNVIVASNSCKGKDVLKLIKIIKRAVYKKYKIDLKEEIIII